MSLWARPSPAGEQSVDEHLVLPVDAQASCQSINLHGWAWHSPDTRNDGGQTGPIVEYAS